MKNKNTNISNAFNIINMYDLNVAGLFTCIPTLFFLVTFLYWKEKPPYHRKPFKLHKVFFSFQFPRFFMVVLYVRDHLFILGRREVCVGSDFREVVQKPISA